jgi:hypothetical protein
VNETFGGGTKKENFQASSSSGAEDDEVGVHHLGIFVDSSCDAVVSTNNGRDVLKIVLLSDIVAESFEAGAYIVEDTGFLDHREGGSEPANIRVGIDGWPMDMDESELGTILNGYLGGSVCGTNGVVREVDAGNDRVEGFILILADKENFDGGLANTFGGQTTDIAVLDCSESARAEDESFRVLLFDEFQSFNEGISDFHEGLDIMCSADDVRDEGFNFLVCELENTVFIVSVVRFELVENILIQDVVANEGEVFGICDAGGFPEGIDTRRGVVDSDEDGFFRTHGKVAV